MRDHNEGPNWDHRSLGDLTWYRIRVVCLICRHFTYLEPRELAKRYGAKHSPHFVNGVLDRFVKKERR